MDFDQKGSKYFFCAHVSTLYFFGPFFAKISTMVTTFDQKLVELLNNWLIEGWPVGNLILCLIALLLSILLCGLIGMERERRGRSAGLRTHLLVGVGSCMLMIISIYGFPAFGANRDVARLAAQIITGVGFLGAGAILHRNSGIKGLTTAGTIWIVMAIGMACGSFNFILAILATALIFLVLTAFKRVESRISNKRPTIVLLAHPDTAVLDKILAVSEEYACSVHSISSDLVDHEGEKAVEVTFNAVFENDGQRVNEFMDALRKATNAISVSILTH